MSPDPAPPWPSLARTALAGLAAFGRGGWRPALGWALSPCVLYDFVLGPWLRRPADTAELVALVAAAGALVAARTVEKARGLA